MLIVNSCSFFSVFSTLNCRLFSGGLPNSSFALDARLNSIEDSLKTVSEALKQCANREDIGSETNKAEMDKLCSEFDRLGDLVSKTIERRFQSLDKTFAEKVKSLSQVWRQWLMLLRKWWGKRKEI